MKIFLLAVFVVSAGIVVIKAIKFRKLEKEFDRLVFSAMVSIADEED